MKRFSFLSRPQTASLPMTVAVLLLLLTVSASASSSAQNINGIAVEQPDPYTQALDYFRQGRYARTVEILQPALQAGGLGNRRASAWLLLG